MMFQADLAWLTTVALVALRFAPLFLAAPVFASSGVPLRLRLILVVALAASLVGVLSVPVVPSASGTGSFVLAALSEFLTGMALVAGVPVAFAAFQLAGRILDTQVGFGIANVFDPVTRAQAPLLGSALDMLALVAFLSLDGHHMIIRGLAESLEHVPPGTALAPERLPALVAQFGLSFSGALAIAGPTLLVLLLVDVGSAVISRTMPQMNIFIVAMPLKIFVGLLVLALSLRYMEPRLRQIFDAIWLGWERLWS